MRALILAAGLGTRLAPLTNDRPKAMVPVNGKPILVKQLENLLENGVEDIVVMTGYRADAMKREIEPRFPGVTLIEIPEYATTNNMYSAWKGLKYLGPGPLLMMNADVFFDSSVIRGLLDDPAENAIVVEPGRYLEESMKVVERGGRLVDISKQVPPEDALGCSIDVYKFGAEAAAAFYRRCCEHIEGKGELRLWSEVALKDALSDVTFKASPIQGRWLEIDNHEDLRDAEALFAV